MARQEYVTSGQITNGRIKVRNWQSLAATVQRWRDCDVVIRIEKAHATRSVVQNAYLWSVVIPMISEHVGFNPDETHAVLKAKFLPKRLAVADGNGEVIAEFVIGGSTTRLDKVEFGEYLENIRQWAAEYLHLIIPDPDPDWREAAA